MKQGVLPQSYKVRKRKIGNESQNNDAYPPQGLGFAFWRLFQENKKQVARRGLPPRRKGNNPKELGDAHIGRDITQNTPMKIPPMQAEVNHHLPELVHLRQAQEAHRPLWIVRWMTSR